ncbi:MAG: hypothetical protein LJE61_00355 [Thiocapsa sp.]|jgi:hypothetical protein|nr:hypothetical protein [Thiocapsa sp.]MCG6896645.1 hypothetical protein [Thiocapsa sp.]MCG6983641.1 hypothetical protein [Thiocapsa sp.]
MPCSTLVRQRLLLLFLAGMLLLFSPFVLQIEALGRSLGVPVLVFYLFATWAVLIGVAAWLVSRAGE